MQNLPLQDRLEEIKSEIERLESVENLSSEEFAQLKSFKAEQKTIGEQLDSEMAQKNLSIRKLERRDIQVLQRLIKDYPQFSTLESGSQLDRIALLLTEACGFGGVPFSTIEEMQVALSYQLNLDVLGHFKNSTWTNREGEVRKRYVNNFADAYKLDPGFRMKLLSEERGEQDSEIVRKVVKPRPETLAAREAEKNQAPKREIQTVKAEQTVSSGSAETGEGVGEKLKSFFKKISGTKET